MNPETMSRVLGIPSRRPSDAGRAHPRPWLRAHGGTRPPSATAKRAAVTRTGVWRLTAAADSSVIADHVADLLARIPVDRGPLDAVDGVQEAFIAIAVTIPAEDDGRGDCEFDVSAELMAGLARVGLPIRVTVDVIKK